VAAGNLGASAASAAPKVDDVHLTVPSFREALRTWFHIGLNSFGGPAGQIAVMHRVLVDEKRWIGEKRFLHALNFCMLLPGPEAQQLATYIGWLFHGWRGGLVAGTLFVLPGALVILILSYIYAGFRDVTAVEALFYGLKCAVLAIVVEAVMRIGKRALKTRAAYVIAIAAFVAIFFFAVPFPIIVAAAAVVGFAQSARAGGRSAPVVDELTAQTGWPRAVRVLALGLAIWFGPLLAIRVALGPNSVYLDIGEFFSKAAVVTFGGAYSVLAYVAQEAVDTYGWLQPGEMLDGLAMAETTPGPLIMVVQFVGFLAAYRDPGALPPMLAGTFGAVVTTWVTFAPCFLWIFLGAPYVEALRGNRALSGALAAITAAVVGVVLNLAVWFSLHTLFVEQTNRTAGPLNVTVPTWSTLDLGSLILSLGAAVATFRYKVGMFKVLAGCAIGGIVLKWILGA
jgi:chromate transporter